MRGTFSDENESMVNNIKKLTDNTQLQMKQNMDDTERKTTIGSRFCKKPTSWRGVISHQKIEKCYSESLVIIPKSSFDILNKSVAQINLQIRK